MQKLDRILKEKEVLNGSNFAGLLGESTEDPIHTLNCITKEAREKKKKLGCCFRICKKYLTL